MNKKKSLVAILVGFGIILILLVVLAVWYLGRKEEEPVSYRETTVEYGNLTVGITQEGVVEIGTTDLSFDLDISALVSTSGSTGSSDSAAGGMMAMGPGNSAGGSGAGGNAFGQIFSLVSERNGYNSKEQSLEIAQVCVEEGQRVEAGDTLYLLTEDSVASIRDQLAEDVENAAAELATIEADQRADRLQAKQNYETASAYGEYAMIEYNLTLRSLEDTLEETKQELEASRQTLEEEVAAYEELQTQYHDAQANFEYVEYGLQEQDKDTYLYGYLTQRSFYDSALATKELLEERMENKWDEIEELEEQIASLEMKVETAQMEYDTGVLEAQENLAIRQLTYDTAAETYDIAISYLDEDKRSIQNTYDQATLKLERFDSSIVEDKILADKAGIVTDMPLEAGDTISKGSTLLTLYDEEDVTMSVELSSSQLAKVSIGDAVNISLTAYPDELFTGVIAEIGEAETDSADNIIYPVSISIEGDVSRLYQGMTGDITFITKEKREVTYVSNRAIIREGTKSYVKMKDENGELVKKQVKTGFSDGVNVEVLEGLSRGDIVLVESKVSGS